MPSPRIGTDSQAIGMDWQWLARPIVKT